MEKTYNPQQFEKAIYDFWTSKGYFTPKVDTTKKPFSIVIPPPNITGQLHMGHALNNTLQDIIIRYKRMKGFCTLWVPGTDHASIATELKIVEQMKKEGITKADIGREGFLTRAWAWRDLYGRKIVDQLKRLGSSCDWTREAFTMDENLNRAVRKVFVKLYNDGLIYRGNRIINWCPQCKTALSDAEVDYSEQDSFMWHVRYPYEDGSGYIEIATTRPETMLGDTAVAVNPKDERYKDKVGKMLKLPLTDRLIPIIADEYVEMDFGTGAVKITPAHDPNDFEVGKRHSLEVIRVMDYAGFMNEKAFAYKGMERYACRKQIEKDLEAQGLLVRKEPYKHNVGCCYRCNTTVEPIVSLQWFVKMKPLALPAIKAVKNKSVKFLPARYEKVYFNWMNNIMDWCISRQLWWGHRIPAYYCENCNETIVSEQAPSICPKCGCTKLKQDEDVLDTWFSSALWPFSTLGYPDNTEELKFFYPTNVLVTAYDIIFFWVARMIFSGLAHMNEKPFDKVFIHGLVRDSEGRKMSKSLGNGIDPLEVIDKYGADSLRFSLANGISQGNDIRYIPEKIEANRNFINKIWNAARFVTMNTENVKIKPLSEVKLLISDRWILAKLNTVIREVNRNLDKYELGIASTKLYDFVWSEFCDWYIELSKPYLYSLDEEQKSNTVSVLMYCLNTILKLMHPYIPFVTEELWLSLGNTEGIMIEAYPTPNAKFGYTKQIKQFQGIMDMIKSIRNIRAETNLSPAKRIKVIFYSPENVSFIKKCRKYIEKLAGVGEIEFIENKDALSNKVVSAVTVLAEIYIPLDELVDAEKEIERLSNEIVKLDKEIVKSQGMLNNAGYVAKAPAQVVAKEREKLQINLDKKAKLQERIDALKE